MEPRPKEQSTAVLDVRGRNWASEKAVVEAVLGRRPGVLRVEANPVAQTATVEFDPRVTSLADLRRWVIECGYHCAGQSVPSHVCDPMVEPDPPPPPHTGHGAGHAGHAPSAGEAVRAPEEVMGHGGHAGMSMAAMVADMRNRFLVAAVFSVPILLWSPIGAGVFEPALGLVLRPEIAALSMSGSSFIVAVNALALKRLRLPEAPRAG
jgi:Cu2+-exporting ATPase